MTTPTSLAPFSLSFWGTPLTLLAGMVLASCGAAAIDDTDTTPPQTGALVITHDSQPVDFYEVTVRTEETAAGFGLTLRAAEGDPSVADGTSELQLRLDFSAPAAVGTFAVGGQARVPAAGTLPSYRLGDAQWSGDADKNDIASASLVYSCFCTAYQQQYVQRIEGEVVIQEIRPDGTLVGSMNITVTGDVPLWNLGFGGDATVSLSGPFVAQ